LEASKSIEKEKEKVTRRRDKAAQEQIEQYQLEMAAGTLQETIAPVIPMDVDALGEGAAPQTSGPPPVPAEDNDLQVKR